MRIAVFKCLSDLETKTKRLGFLKPDEVFAMPRPHNGFNANSTENRLLLLTKKHSKFPNLLCEFTFIEFPTNFRLVRTEIPVLAETYHSVILSTSASS